MSSATRDRGSRGRVAEFSRAAGVLVTVAALAFAIACVAQNPGYLQPADSTETGASTRAMTGAGTDAGLTSSGSSAGAGSEGATGTTTGPASLSDDPVMEDVPGGEPGCVESELPLAKTPPDIMFVIDKSRSMFEVTWPGFFGVESRWASLHAALLSAVSNYQGQFRGGLVLAPKYGAYGDSDALCQIDTPAPNAPLTLDVAEALMDELPPADGTPFNFSGGNPLRRAFDAAVAHLAEEPGDGAEFVVIVTDGAPNCPGDQNTLVQELLTLDEGVIASIASAREDLQILTYVIGLGVVQGNVIEGDLEPLGDAYDTLLEMAGSGGVPAEMGGSSFAETHSASQLEEALLSIGTMLACAYPVDDEFLALHETDGAEVVLEVDGEAYGELDSCLGLDGYVFEPGPVRPLVLLCGELCQHAQGGAVLARATCP